MQTRGDDYLGHSGIVGSTSDSIACHVSGVELRTLYYENPGSINEYLTIDSGGYLYEQPSCINCSIWLDASQRSRDGV